MGNVSNLLWPRLGSFASAARRVDRLRRAILAGPADVPAIVARVTQFAPEAPDDVVDHVLHLAERTSSLVWTDGLAELIDDGSAPRAPTDRCPGPGRCRRPGPGHPPAVAVELAAGLPEGRLFIVDGAGHIAMLERPDRLNPELRAFARQALGLGVAKTRRRRKGAA